MHFGSVGKTEPFRPDLSTGNQATDFIIISGSMPPALGCLDENRLCPCLDG